MSITAPNTDQQPASRSLEANAVANNQRGDLKNGRFKKTRKVIRWISAYDAWKKQASILRHRATFPLLRSVIRAERDKASNQIELNDISTQVLERSLLSHYLILLFVVPASLWSAYTTIKGLSAGIRFDIWFNPWLLQGVPVFIFCMMKTLTSNKSRKLISVELGARKKAKDNA